MTPHMRLTLYEISKDTLGTGATSDVFRGTRKSDGRTVAVKVLNKLTADPHRLENLEEDIKGARMEAELMKSVRSCDCCRVLSNPWPWCGKTERAKGVNSQTAPHICLKSAQLQKLKLLNANHCEWAKNRACWGS